MASITIKVAPDVLKAKATSIDGQINKVEKALKTVENQITASKNYWEGDASNTHQKKYKDLTDDIQEVLKELKAHPRNLLTMAELYSSTESQLQAAANELPANLLS